MRIWLSAVLLTILLLASGCTTVAPQASVYPQITPAPGYVVAPDAEQHGDWSLRLRPAFGPVVLVRDGFAAERILAAANDQRALLEDVVGRFGNRLELLDSSGNVQGRFDIHSEGQLVMRDEDDRVFPMPEYVYYLLEQHLWPFAGSLKDSLIRWDPTQGTAAMETEIDRLIKSAEVAAWGYADAYFQTYEVLGMSTDTKDEARVYLQLSYAGYAFTGEQFAQRFQSTAPARLVFTRVRGDRWQLTDFRQADPNAEGRQALYDSLRKVLPYEYMEDVMKQMEDTTALTREVHRQAADYLRDRGLSNLTIGD